MKMSVTKVSAREVLPWREKFRGEMSCQIVHDSLHSREGCTQSYQLNVGPTTAGYGSILLGGPWKGTRTVFEFYVVPEHREQSGELFASFVSSAAATAFVVQTNDALFTDLLRPWLARATCEKIVFQDRHATHLPANGARLRRTTPADTPRIFPHQLEPVGDWLLEKDGVIVATGGLLFHYNPPYGDIHLEVDRSFRRRGLGSYLVQELKRICHEGGNLPCARCRPANAASHATLLKAGFAPCAQILTGPLPG